MLDEVLKRPPLPANHKMIEPISLLTLALPLLSFIDFAACSNPKRGIAYVDIATASGDIAVTDNSQISWVYAWMASPPGNLRSSGLEFVPMQWGSDGADQFISTVEAQGAKTVLVSRFPLSSRHADRLCTLGF